MKRIFVINGANLNLTGIRRKDIYGFDTLDTINEELAALGDKLRLELSFYQFNSEGAIIDTLHSAMTEADGVLLNAGAYTHYSYAIRDAVEAIGLPVIEVHMSNIYQREDFRKLSVLSPVCIKTIAGYGKESYSIALKEINDVLRDKK